MGGLNLLLKKWVSLTDSRADMRSWKQAAEPCKVLTDRPGPSLEGGNGI